MRYAVIGTGRWGTNHARVGAELRDAGVVDDLVVCDIDAERARRVAAEHDARYETDYTALDVDAATLATPADTHEPLATALLERGVDCLVEKPLALSADSAWNIVDCAATHDRTLAVGHLFRYHPAIVELKRLVDAGELGRIQYLHTNRFSYRVPRADAGILLSVAIHDLDVYGYLLGIDPDRLYCHADAFVRETEDTATVVVDYDAGSERVVPGASGVINASWQVLSFGKARQLTVVGTERTAFVDYLSPTELTLYDASVEDTEDGLSAQTTDARAHTFSGGEPLKLEVADFLESSAAGRPPHASGAVGARAVELVEHAREASSTGSTVAVTSPPRAQLQHIPRF